MAKTSKRLELCTFKLNTLLHVTKAINEHHSIDDLVARYNDILKDDLNIGKVVIYKLSGNIWECILISGYEMTKDTTIDVASDLLQFEDIEFLLDSPNPALRAFDIIIPVYNNEQALAFILIGDIDEETEGISPTIKHLHFIQTLSNLVLVAMENVRLIDQNIQQEAFKRELALASKMQNMLIPENDKLPSNEHVLVKAFYSPHFEVGGDYYDVIRLSDDEIGFCIADVSGKGVSAALVMSNFQAHFRAQFGQNKSLQDLAGILNNQVMLITNGEKFVTVFLAKYNYQTKELEYINAGHNPPILYEVEDNRITFLTKGCVGLGMLDEIPIVKKGKVIIDQRSKLLCYTDGIVEFLDEDGVEEGTKALENDIGNSGSIIENIQEIIRHNKLEEGSNRIFDDISLLGIEFM